MPTNIIVHPYGYLELFLGPMWAGKTTALVDIYKRATTQGLSCIAINHEFDVSPTKSVITSHNNDSIPCVSCKQLHQIFNTSAPKTTFSYDIILINEGQFFPDLYDWTKYMVNILCKNIYIAALDGDYKQICFPNIIQVLPQADSFTKLHNMCKECNSRCAIFTQRTCLNTSTILPGTDYIPLCRKCYNDKSI